MNILILPDIPGWVMESIALGIIDSLKDKFNFTMKYSDEMSREYGKEVVDWDKDIEKYDLIYLMLPSYIPDVDDYSKIVTSFHGGPGTEAQADKIQRMGLEEMRISYVSYQTRCRVESEYKSSQTFSKFAKIKNIRRNLGLRDTDKLNLRPKNDIQIRAVYTKYGFNLKNLHFTPYGIDTDFFNQEKINDKFCCGYAGWARYLMDSQLDHRRGNWIINAWYEDKFDLSIAGGLKIHGNEQILRFKKVHPYIKAGLYDRSDIRDFYKELSCYLVPDKLAGGPMPVLEAGAMGIPVITTDCGHCGDIIEDGYNGKVIDNFKDFKSAIQWMKSHPKEREILGQNLKNYIKQYRTWNSVSSYWEKFFKGT